MSRSYRKPIATDGYKSKWRPKMKSLANRLVRRAKGIADGKAYRKIFNSWNICDWKFAIHVPDGTSKVDRIKRKKAIRK